MSASPIYTCVTIRSVATVRDHHRMGWLLPPPPGGWATEQPRPIEPVGMPWWAYLVLAIKVSVIIAGMLGAFG